MNLELMDFGGPLDRIAFRPTDPAPSRNEAYDVRAAWSERYMRWVLAQVPIPKLPDDVEPTHRYQVEFNSCVRDPQRYERTTMDELDTETMH